MDFKSMLSGNSDALVQLGAGLLGGRTANEQLAGGLTGFAQGRKQNKTLDWLRQRDPEIAAAMESGLLDGSGAAQAYFQKQRDQLQAQKPKQPIEINGRLVDPTDYHVIADFSTPKAAPEAYQTVSPEEAKQMGLPAGTYQKSTTTGKISQIGGSGVNIQLPGEMGSRIGLGDQFLTELPTIKSKLPGDDAAGAVWRAQYAAGVGEPGALWRRVETGKEALVRNLTGAGMSQGEAENQAARYAISATDSSETMKSKLDGLEADLRATRAGAIAARSGGLGEAPPSAGAPPAGGAVPFTDYFKQ